MTTFQILWYGADNTYHVDEVYAYDAHEAVARGFQRHPDAQHIRVF